MDENLKITTLDIYDVEKMQGELFPDSPTPEVNEEEFE
jgi:hypothetical protein